MSILSFCYNYFFLSLLRSFNPSDHPRITSVDHESANHSDRMSEWIRIGGVEQPFALGSFGASITLFVTAPVSAAAIHPALYTAYLTVVFLGIITTFGLSIFSALMDEGPTVGWVQKKLIYFTFCFVSLACILRLQLALSLVHIGFGAVLVLTGTVLMVLLYLLLGSISRRGSATDMSQEGRVNSVILNINETGDFPGGESQFDHIEPS